MLEDCTVCPRNCHTNRMRLERGYCGEGREMRISSHTLHFGEEPELVGTGGSGTIFLTGCNLGCVFCQNYEISHLQKGEAVDRDRFIKMILALQHLGAHNINFVSPTHFTPQIIEAVILARRGGLRVPIVYNCGGYESLQTLKLLEGIVDIYMPDAKFAQNSVSGELCGVSDYAQILKQALKEMHRQVGDLKVDENGIAITGLLVRHLVLPDGLAGTEKILKFIASEVSVHTYVNIMNQYRPNTYTLRHPHLGRYISHCEYTGALEIARKVGLYRGF